MSPFLYLLHVNEKPVPRALKELEFVHKTNNRDIENYIYKITIINNIVNII